MEHRASAATVSRKFSNGIYDGVFAAPTKLSSPVQDYTEIFGGGDASRASSIPVLDVPELRDRKVSVDVRTSNLDYADIFGGFRDSDYAIPLEELIAKPRKGRSSSNEARTPAYTKSPLDVSNPSKQAASYEEPCQSFGEVKQFNMLYQKTNVPTKNGTTGTTHIAQLHAVPGYTRLIDESTPLRKTQDDGPATSVGTDTHSKMYCAVEGKCSQKSMSGLPPGATNKQTPQGSVKIQRKSTQSKSFSSDVLFDANDFGLGTYSPQVQPPSGLSSNAGNSERESKVPVASNFESVTLDATDAGASSPPYFGEEMDKNSIAAASAAAVKLAIEKAQARMRLAKELMERKKESFQSREKLNFKDGLRTQKKRGGKIAVKANKLQEEKVQELYEQVNTTVELSDWMGKKDALKAGQVTLSSGDMKELETEEAVEGMQTKGIKTSQADHMPGEMKEHEAEQYCELVRAVKHSAPALEVKQTNHVNESITSPYEIEQEIGMANSRPEKQVDNNMKCKVEEEVHEWEDRVKKLNTCEGERELEAHASISARPRDQEAEKKLERAQKREETEDVHVSREQDDCDEKPETPKPMGVWEDLEALELEENTSMRLKETHDRVEKGKKRGGDEDQEECTNGSRNILEMVTGARSSQDICGNEENGKKLDESRGSEENEMEPGEPCKWEENEYQQKDADSGEKTEESGDGNLKQEMIGEVFKTFDEGEESDEYFEDSKSEENERFEGEENGELNKTYQVEDRTRQEETCEWADTAEIWTEIDQREEETVEAAQEAFKYDRNNLEAADGMGTHEHWSTTKETCLLKEIAKDVEATSEAILYEGESTMKDTSSFEFRGSEKGSESPVENDLDYSEIFDTNGVTSGAIELDEMIEQMKEPNDAFPSNANVADLGKTEMKSGKKQNGQYVEESEIVSNVEEHYNGLVHELRESNKSIKETELLISNGDNGNHSNSTYDERWVPGREEEAAQQPSTSDRREKTREIAQESESSRSSERFRENNYETLLTEERETKYTEQKEVGTEREHIKKLDEAKERENKREKERIAVQRAIREARERAFTEARERAAMEKSTAGARQKPVTETRERLGKASVEANNQSSVDKEAKLKAERAAVERATAEARERALEKAKSGKAASDARNQAEKCYGGSRDDGMRQSFPSADLQNRASGLSNSSRSSNHGERSEGANSELAQRFKGEWERQQRTAERAAKALAEKNMRDLLVQKEQAERNRLAGALDADIKRWSGGKERNLRALLSTLHYILGPESGWQPVPLTDIMATDAVKKTYRRATLFVHPDKLQQRGASIQQKYTCEKVFDLLKEAWDKFKREEQ